MTSTQLSMRWMPVTDPSGRTHLEAVWLTEQPQSAQTHATTQTSTQASTQAA